MTTDESAEALSEIRKNPAWREMLRELEVSPSKALGQNFLHDRKIVRRIVSVAEVDETTNVLEVGPGLGILTEELISKAGTVTAIELDERLAERLQNHFDGRARVVQGDILETDVSELMSGAPYVVVANLPYSIATAAIQRILEASHPPTRLIIMVQREVAERMASRPPDMSILSAAVQFYSKPKIQFRIGNGAFIPRPRVESAVIRLDRHESLPLPDSHHSLFFRLMKGGFAQKRKRVDNSIAASLGLNKRDVRAAVEQAGIDPSRRAETLDIPDWVRLVHAASEMLDV